MLLVENTPLVFLYYTGVTLLLIGDRAVPLPSALEVAETELMGRFATCWPLTKVLDIGGTERSPNYATKCNSQQSGMLKKLRESFLDPLIQGGRALSRF